MSDGNARGFAPPDTTGAQPDIHNLLNSTDWYSRLEEARLKREKILADRERKPVVQPSVFPAAKISRIERLPLLEPARAQGRGKSAAGAATVVARALEAIQVAPPLILGQPPAAAPVAPLPEPEAPPRRRRPRWHVPAAYGAGLLSGLGVAALARMFG